MSVTIESRSIQMTAASDAFAQPVKIKEIWFGGAGMTAGQRLTILEEASGSVIADHFITVTNGNELIRANCGWQKGITVSAYPAGGTTVLTFITE